MSKPLSPNCTDFQACQFFKDCKNQIRRIAQESKLQKTISKTIARVEQLRSNKTEALNKMLLDNIVIDFLRSFNLNYTYPVFLRETNVISEEVASKSKLAALIGIQDELNNDERLNVSLIELMVKKIQVYAQKGKELIECGSQIDIISKTGVENNVLLIENKAKEIRQQVEQREKKYYEKQLENMRLKEIMQLRFDITKEVEERYNKQKIKLNEKFQQLIGKAKSNESSSKLKQQNDKLLTKNYELSEQITKLRRQLEGLKRQNVKHDCTKHPDYLKFVQATKKQRKQLEDKKKQLDYALRNINTKVEDLVMQKKRIEGQKKSDVFQQEIKINRQNKDHMIDLISGEMKQMCNRVKVLDDQNKLLRQNLKDTTQKLKSKENEILKIQKQLEKQQDEGGMISSNKIIGRHQDENNVKAIKPLGYKKQNASSGVSNQAQKVSVCVGVCAEDIAAEFKQPEQSKVTSQSESDYEQFEDKQLEHDKKLAEIKANINIIKKKVLFLVDSDI